MGLPVFRFTLTNQPKLPPFGVFWSTQPPSGGVGGHPWSIDETPSVSLPAFGTSLLITNVTTFLFLPGTYDITYSVTVTAAGLSGLNFAFVSGSTLVGNDSTPNLSGAGTFTGTVSVTATQQADGFWITATDFSINSKLMTINSLTIVNTSGQQISEPDGWVSAIMKLERHPDFHSLVEFFEGSFVFYGSNGIQDGGIDYIKGVESIYGSDADLEILIEVSFDEIVYDTVFSGLLDISELQEVKDNKLEVPIIRNDLWTKFISRRQTPVNLLSRTDIDGVVSSVIDGLDVNLTSQRVRQVYQADYTKIKSDLVESNRQYAIPAGDYGVVSFEDVLLDEIKKSYNYVNTEDPEIPFETFDFEYAGSYNFQFNLNISDQPSGVLGTSPVGIGMRFQINDDAAITVTGVNVGTPGVDQSGRFSFDQTFVLQAHDLVRIYFINTSGGLVTFYAFSGNISTSTTKNITVTADTEWLSSEAKGYYLHDLFAENIKRTCGDNVFYSEVLGRTDTNSRSYDANGCFSPFAIMKGLQLRGYLITEKPFFVSFDQAWKGANPIFNLGLGYEDVSSVEVIWIE